MDLALLCNIVILYIFERITPASLNGTDTGQSTSTPKTNTTEAEEDQIFGNPFWIGFTVILFICLVVVSLVVSLTYGIYKFRQEAFKRGTYKHKCRVYREPDDVCEVDYDIFTTSRQSLHVNGESNGTSGEDESGSSTGGQNGTSGEESNVTYLGAN